MRTVSSNHAASGCYPEVFLSFARHMATMDTLAALGRSSLQLVRVQHHALRRKHGW